jgi:hypothetical protein
VKAKYTKQELLARLDRLRDYLDAEEVTQTRFDVLALVLEGDAAEAGTAEYEAVTEALYKNEHRGIR